MKETMGMRKYDDCVTKFNAVFNKDGTIKVCGRQACKELIIACMEYAPDIDFGNPNTGMMNVDNIRQMFAQTNA